MEQLARYKNNNMKYNPSKIEKKWQKHWEKIKINSTKDEIKGKKNFMLLVEFPYSSGNLHVGHWYTYSLSDILARYLRMNGKNVSYPIGFDAFGLPAENAAIKNNLHPSDWTKKNISYMKEQLKRIGATFDWNREVQTINPQYYKWNQWIFLKMYENGLVYRDKTKANWCPKDKTVLANEQVVNGCCERCGERVEQRNIEQWMMKITKFADELFEGVNQLDWPRPAKIAQRNWIGKSDGFLINFSVENINEKIEVFTTRADTIFGATYLVLSPEHPMVEKITSDGRRQAIGKYIQEAKRKTDLERQQEVNNKTGVFTGSYAINPADRKKIPIWIADYVLSSYGTGAIMAVPAHDQRDWDFAKKFGLEIVPVIQPKDEELPRNKPFLGEGQLINSGSFSGLENKIAVEKISLFISGKKSTDYRLRDWIISRQRYWGTPIPMIFCSKCGWLPEKEKNLPIKLPDLKNYMPTDEGKSPLDRAENWKNIKCPNCNEPAERETDTMDTFVDSSWYFLRYADPKNKNKFADNKKIKKWMPIPLYVGGAEHITMHLIYSRFIIKALNHMGYLDFDEPFLARRTHGIILGPDNQKMSKSKGNVIDPDEEVKKSGADSIRMYFGFIGPFSQGGSWNPQGLNGISRFLNRIWNFYQEQIQEGQKPISKKDEEEIKKSLHLSIKKIGEDIENLEFNTAISSLMECLNSWQKVEGKFKKIDLDNFLRILSPLAPHMAEELWQVMGNKKSIHLEKWPKYSEKIISRKNFDLVIQVNGKVRSKSPAPVGINEDEAKKLAFEDGKIKELISDKKIKKIVFIKDKLINIVVG